jgi:hypothetical protein
VKAVVVTVMLLRLHSFNSGRFCIIRPANGEVKQSEISKTLRKETAYMGKFFPTGNCPQNKYYNSHISNK